MVSLLVEQAVLSDPDFYGRTSFREERFFRSLPTWLGRRLDRA